MPSSLFADAAAVERSAQTLRAKDRLAADLWATVIAGPWLAAHPGADLQGRELVAAIVADARR